MMRALRPDRMTYAVRCFVEEKLGAKYVEARTIEFSKSFEESSSSTPIFFILSPGVDPLVVGSFYFFFIIFSKKSNSIIF